ncbi:hypothetical protein [Flavobacterium sp.]|uniref:hypothetical protein n=1 Tax=Flavobacterium sp. TaxID=239 RepID=UPI00260D69D6|nr:hypothetical protein [Flavobacterium sp.]
MINNETHTIDWILSLRNKLGKRIDPKLIEKVIWALTLLEQLRLKGLSFTFKGGTEGGSFAASPQVFVCKNNFTGYPLQHLTRGGYILHM